jgi:outer membrane protein TolC
MKYFYALVIILWCWIIPAEVLSQIKQDTAVLQDASLANCVQYALRHQPVLQQSALDEEITEKTIRSKLADWYPQIDFSYNIQHNFQLPTTYFDGIYIPNGTFNSSNLGLGVNQNIFNRDVLLASRTANDVRKQSKQNTVANSIDVVANVSKAFYDVLLTQKQVAVLDEAIVRLERSLKDTYNQYQDGIVDKTDYKRAAISLNNTKAQRKQTSDLIVAKYSYLKQLMGYPDSGSLNLQYDSARMESEAMIDTVNPVIFENRIEYQLLQTQKSLQVANLKYYKWSYLPTVSAFGGYNLGYLNNNFAKTYSQTFANSDIGLQLSIPIFQGNKRVYQVQQAELEVRRVDWDEVLLKSRISTQYAQAIAAYKGNLANYTALKDNVQLADEVYKTIRLQYTSGIKTYLDVIIAEADLRTAELNYYNALYQLLQSKIDVQQALGTIKY